MFRKTTLQSGLRVVTEQLKGTKAVTVLVLAGAGSRYENHELRGISHFLEHMFFKGADKYSNTKEVSEAIDGVGGEFNAFTGKEYAGYYVKVSSESVELACDVLSDMLLNSKFDQEEIEKERGVILEEYNMYQDTPMYQIGWNFENLVFGEQPLGWDQIGTKELIKSVNHDDFVKYKKKLYTADNLVVAVVGNIDNDDAVSLVQKYFDIPESKKAYDFEPLKKIDGGKVYLKEKKTEQAHVAVGFPGYAEVHKDHWALKLLSVILGGNMSSRMFLGVREAKGLAYYIHTTTDNYMDGGAIVTNAGVDLKRIDEAIEGIIEQYRLVRDEDIPAEELKKAKSYLKGKMVLSLEDSEEFAHLLSKYELLHGKARSPEEIMKAIDDVKISDIKRVAEDLFEEEKMKVAVIGPYSDEEHFKKMLKF
ncbi:insulinase family protein [Candidatus Peregrinibacteria bacterium]|jgi:predicted Zn-dependent peptidase|nr:insulinase family protein [Candidatus Peregrinibacteria bacterium]MBT7736618.1 insulinase family protein [Candidatus Peregrinibacteria bacterium]